MKSNYIKILTFLIFTITTSAQVEKFELYTVGTKTTFYPNFCGTAIPEAEGKISFCDEAGNLGVVERSYGLNSNNVIKIVPNYFNNDEVFITDTGYSIHKADGTWQNIPRIAIPTENLSVTIVSEEAIVTPDGKLLFGDTNESAEGLVYLDLTTLVFDSFLLSEGSYPKEFVHDPDTGISYALVRNGTQVGLFSISGNTITNEGILSGIPQNNINWDSTAIHDGFLYVGGNNGLYKISLTDGGQNEFYDENSLPAQGLSNLEFDSTGNLWMSFAYVTTGGIARFEPDTETFEFFTLENPGNGNYDITDFTFLSDDEILGNALGYDGFVKLEPNGTEPVWTLVPQSDFESLGLPIANNRFNSINSFNGSMYAAFSGVNPDSATNFFEILKLSNEVWSGLNDDVAGNISASFANTSPGTFTNGYQLSVSGNAGGVWWYSANNDLLTFLSDDNITAVYDFPGNDDYLVLDTNGNPTTDSGSNIVKYNAPLIQNIPTTGFDPDWITTYKDELWAFDRQTDVLHVYRQDAEIATYSIDNYDNNNPMSADSFGNVVYSEDSSSQNELTINTFNTSTGVTNTITYNYAIDPFPNQLGDGILQQLSLPDGKMAFVAEASIFLWDNGTITEVVLQDLGFESFEVIGSATADEMGNLILLLQDPKLVRIIDPFGSLNIEAYRLGLTSSFSSEQSLLPEINFGNPPTIVLDNDGGIWVHGQGQFLKTTLSNSIPPPANFESFRIKGQVYFDTNDNDILDAGELFKNQRVAMIKEGTSFPRYTITNSKGEFQFLYQGVGNYTVTLLGSDPNVFAENITTTFNVSNVEQDTDLGTFKLQTRYIDALLVKSAEKQGAWGFDRAGFENTFTTAIGNISATKNLNNLSFQFIYQNEDDNSENIVPQIQDITIYRVTSQTNIPVIYKTIIAPRSHDWRVNDASSNYTITLISITPQITTTDNKVEVDFTIDALNAKDMIVIEVKTDLFAPEQNGTNIEFGLSSVGGDNLDDDGGPLSIPLIPRPIDNPKLRFPEDLAPFPDPNDPIVDPLGPEGPVYAPRPQTTQIFSSYDPNDKLVSPGLPNVLNEVDLGTPYLTYTIRFENEGNFSAKDVYILDEIDENLDLNSIQFIEASHDVNIDELSIDGKTNLRFFFEDIFLDYTANDPIASQGYVKFAIRPIEGIAVNAIVENTAAIYFDQNLPIITNTTQNIFLELLLSTEDFSNENLKVKVFPNPVLDNLQIVLPKQGKYKVQVFDMSGRQLNSIDFSSQLKVNLPLEHLATGHYILKVIDANTSASVKIIKN